MHRTALAKRRAGYKRVLRQYRDLNYIDTRIEFQTRSVKRHCVNIFDINRLPRSALYFRTAAPDATLSDLTRRMVRFSAPLESATEAFASFGAALRAAANTMRMIVPVADAELHICIDADCPACGWPERWFSPDRSLFGCSKCSFTSTQRDGPIPAGEEVIPSTPRDLAEHELGPMSGIVHLGVPGQYLKDVELASRLAAEIVDEVDRGYSPRARKRAGLGRDVRRKRDVLLEFWRWLQALSIEETGSMLQIPEVVIKARAGE